MSTLVRVPATTANLGPGFDCLGLALDLWNEVEIEVAGSGLQISIEGEGQSTLPTYETNAIVQAMQFYAKRHGKVLPASIRLHCRNNIPLGSGLGSSAATAVAGILAATAILDIPEEITDQLECAAQIEGHPDNVAPCLLGGLVASLVDNDRVVSRKLPVAPLDLLIVTPEFTFPTHQARAALTDRIPHKDAVFNISRAVLLTEALRSGDLELLSTVMQDRLHQPYRIPLIPGAADAIAAAKKAGAVAAVLSGAGPSLLVLLRKLSDGPNISVAMVEAFALAGISARVLIPKITNEGASELRIYN